MTFFLRLAAIFVVLAFASTAEAAPRFWVGGTGTWDNVSTTNWSTTSGGAGGSAAPTSADAVTFDGGSGASAVITVNANVTAASVVLGTTGGNFTGTLDFSVNNNSPTFGTFSFAGLGARTLNMGNGTWTMTGTTGTIFDIGAGTLTLNPNSSTLLLSATATGARSLLLNSRTLNNITVTNPAVNAFNIDFASAAAFSVTNLTLTNVTQVRMPQTSTVTVSGTLDYSGSASKQAILYTNGPATTLSVANATTLNWLAVQNITKAGAGSISVLNGFDAGGNTGVTITTPSGGGGGRIIGGWLLKRDLNPASNDNTPALIEAAA
jgi:hypothetical protein